MTDIATSDVIMTEIIIYCVASIFIVTILDFYAAKKIGDRRRPGYRILKTPRALTLFVIGAFTFVIGILCLVKDLTVSRYTLTYFGLPYFIMLVYYMVKVFRRVKAETNRRKL